jgi:hypothetical protein
MGMFPFNHKYTEEYRYTFPITKKMCNESAVEYIKITQLLIYYDSLMIIQDVT